MPSGSVDRRRRATSADSCFRQLCSFRRARGRANEDWRSHCTRFTWRIAISVFTPRPSGFSGDGVCPCQARRPRLQACSTHRNWFVTPAGSNHGRSGLPTRLRAEKVPPNRQRITALRLPRRRSSVTEFAKFRPEHRIDVRSQGDDTCPAHMMDWYAAAAYCNWLNEQEGIEPDQWCYQPNEDGNIRGGMTIVAGLSPASRIPVAACLGMVVCR